jgi:hypothetical protein
MSNVNPTDLDDLAAGLEFIGKHLHDHELEESDQDRMIGAGFLCKLIARNAKEMAIQMDESNMSQEEIKQEGRDYLKRIK